MNEPLEEVVVPDPGTIDCWRTVGVRGDRSCPKLAQYAHCAYCPSHAAAALRLLDGLPPLDYVEQWTSHVSEPETAERAATSSYLVFRIGSEWLALPTMLISEVAHTRLVHTLPGRTGASVLGVVNVHGELLTCLSIARLLGVVDGQPSASPNHAQPSRLLVLRRDDVRIVTPVDEVGGVHDASPDDLQEPPATVASPSAYSQKLLAWNGHVVGVLDDELLFYAFKRSLA